MIGFLVSAIVLLVILWVVKLILDAIEIPANIKQIAWIIIGLIVLLVVLSWFGVDLGLRGGTFPCR